MKTKSLYYVVFAVALALTGCKEPKPEPEPEPEVNVLDKITDPVFLAYCQNAMDNEQELYFYSTVDWTHAAWDTDGNGKLSTEEAAAVGAIAISGHAKEESEKLTSLAGIEYFTGLILFDCSYNRLTELDVSGFASLYELYCFENRLTSLDVSDCTSLNKLICHANRLTSLDVSDFVGLIDLSCSSNQLSSLDISVCTALTRFNCAGNPGDKMSKFPVRAWFNNNSIPDYLETYFSSWNYNDKTISIDFQKTN